MFGYKKMKKIIFFHVFDQFWSIFEHFWRFSSKTRVPPGEMKKHVFLEAIYHCKKPENFQKFIKLGGGGTQHPKYLGFL